MKRKKFIKLASFIVLVFVILFAIQISSFAATKAVTETKSPYKSEYVKFYESGYDTPDQEYRIYADKFPQSIARYINWETGIKYETISASKSVTVKQVFYKPDGTVDGTGISEKDEFVLEPGNESVFSWGFGSDDSNVWDLGKYKVEVWIDQYKIFTGTFEICAGNEGRKALPVKEIAKKADAVLQINAYDIKNEKISSGSGFVISADGKVVTNYHVIDKAMKLEVITYDNKKYSIEKVIGYSSKKDIAVLQLLNAKDLPCMTLGNSDLAELGEDIIAIGNPLGLTNTISTGIISSIRSNIFRKAGNCKDIQISAPISSGSSGGALFNVYGDVIGITYAGLEAIGGENLNFAIPINEVTPFVNMTTNYSLDQVYKLEHILAVSEGCDYEGDLANGLPNGSGKMAFKDGDTYTGDWVNGLMSGNGVYTWANGDTYNGGFKNGFVSGYGRLTSTDGTTYEGNWLNGCRHGEGKLSGSDGSVIYGNWVNDKLNGNSQYEARDGSTHAVLWLDDKIIKVDGKTVSQ